MAPYNYRLADFPALARPSVRHAGPAPQLRGLSLLTARSEAQPTGAPDNYNVCGASLFEPLIEWVQALRARCCATSARRKTTQKKKAGTSARRRPSIMSLT